MHEVAKVKWIYQLAIDDPAREQQSLEALLQQSEGLDPRFTTRFFQAQFQAAQQMQREDFASWKEFHSGPFAPLVDLKNEVHSLIDRMNLHMLHLLREISSTSDTLPPLFRRPADHIPPAIWQEALTPLLCKLLFFSQMCNNKS